MKCLFLGYNERETKLIRFLKNKNIKVKNYKKNLSKKILIDNDIVISFGYKKIIPKSLLKNLKNPIINLHISFLPYNRGANPNFWSFVDDTKKGVTIHEINSKIDAGNIIFQKEIKFNIKKNKNLTFKETYKTLILEIEKLFINNYKVIINNEYKTKKNKISIGTMHKKKDLLKYKIKNWDMKIYEFLINNCIKIS